MNERHWDERIATPTFPCSIPHVSVIDSFSVRFCPKKLSSLLCPILHSTARAKDSGIWEIIVTLAIIAGLSSLFESAVGGSVVPLVQSAKFDVMRLRSPEQWWLIQVGFKWSDLAHKASWLCCLMFGLPEPHVGADPWFQTRCMAPTRKTHLLDLEFRWDRHPDIYFDLFCMLCILIILPLDTTPYSPDLPSAPWQDSEFANPDISWLSISFSFHPTFSLPSYGCHHVRSLPQAWQSQASRCPLKIQILWVCSWEERIWMICYLLLRTCFTDGMLISTDVQGGV